MKRTEAERTAAIARALEIEGWMLESELAQLYDWASDMDSIVEVGSWKGRSTFALRAGSDGTVEAVDTFTGSPGDGEHYRRVKAAGGSTLAEFIANTAAAGPITITVKDSIEASADHVPVDMVFIDAGHSYAEVLADLRAWRPLARKLICGHDWQFGEVRRAVSEVLGEIERVPGTSLWYFRVPARRPLFSILHSSARPDSWRAVYDDWMRNAVNPKDVEYVLCVDPRWGFPSDPAAYENLPANIHVVLNNQRRCYVDGVNLAALASTGSILIVNADDQFSCDAWDSELKTALANKFDVPWCEVAQHGAGLKFVVEVSTGTPNEHERAIMVMPILSRARYERLGFVFFPEYESMFADNDFCESAIRDGVVIGARHLVFPHKHPWFTPGVAWDPVYGAQNHGAAFRSGYTIFDRRRAAGFAVALPKRRRTIALCLSGERFEGVWVDWILNLYAHLVEKDFAIFRIRAATTNVYITREEIRRTLANAEVVPDLCLWLDDDNLLSLSHFDKLLAGLDAHPECDAVAGWCWIHNESKGGFMPSCGEWAPDGLHWNPFPPSFAHQAGLRPFDCGGLPCILMRYSALEKAGPGCFLPLVDNRLEHGLTGEDMSFFRNAEKGGAKFLVDPEVRLPHLKYVTVEPQFPEEGRVPVKVACMIRAKNEGRWIERVIESVKAICENRIYVMEDGSVDDTAAVAREHGAAVLTSPFVGEGFNEVRDKDWLLGQVVKDCAPDWILAIDGDEELEPGGCEKLRRALEVNPPVDCFSLRVLYLWDSVEQFRFDGVYEKMARQSLFRGNAGLSFRSYYEGGGANHCGLHCSNAPDLGGARGGMRLATMPTAYLLHYGYLHRADRIRKFEWITKLDPDNAAEDFYRHMVQGDIPEVPKDEKLKLAGPLVLQGLPARMVPKFDNGVPGPWAWRGPWPTGHTFPVVETSAAD